MKSNKILSFYKILISPALHMLAGPNAGCKFYPTCSDYAQEAITRHGIIKGTWYSILRLLRCHPFNKQSGYDPVAETVQKEQKCCG